jgi:hypothetical protein
MPYDSLPEYTVGMDGGAPACGCEHAARSGFPRSAALGGLLGAGPGNLDTTSQVLVMGPWGLVMDSKRDIVGSGGLSEVKLWVLVRK